MSGGDRRIGQHPKLLRLLALSGTVVALAESDQQGAAALRLEHLQAYLHGLGRGLQRTVEPDAHAISVAAHARAHKSDDAVAHRGLTLHLAEAERRLLPRVVNAHTLCGCHKWEEQQ